MKMVCLLLFSLGGLWGNGLICLDEVHVSSGISEFMVSPLLVLFFVSNACTGVSESADALYACEAVGVAGSDDDELDVNFKRASNGDCGKKRRVVLDDSDDDYENDVNLGSPDPPKGQSSQYSKQKNLIMDMEKGSVNFDTWKECKTNVKEEKSADVLVKPTVKQDSSVSKNANVAGPEELVHENTSDGDSRNAKRAADNVPASPKRRKVLKRRIDDRGREGTTILCPCCFC